MDKEYLLQKKYPKQDMVIRILGLLCGVGMIILSVLNFITYTISQPVDVVLPIYYAAFGVLMILGEMRPGCIIVYWRFLVETFGKSMFYIFAGTLCIRTGNVMQYIMAGLDISVGLFILCCKAVDGEPQGCDPPDFGSSETKEIKEAETIE